MPTSLQCKEETSDVDGEIVASVIQAVALLLTVGGALVGYLLNEVRDRTARTAAKAADEVKAALAEAREAQQRAHESELDSRAYKRKMESDRLQTQMHNLVTPMLNAVHAMLHCSADFCTELCQSYGAELLAPSTAGDTLDPAVAASLRKWLDADSNYSLRAPQRGAAAAAAAGEAAGEGGTIKLADFRAGRPGARGFGTASAPVFNGVGGTTTTDASGSIRDVEDNINGETWDASALSESDLELVDPGFNLNRIYLTHTPSFYLKWFWTRKKQFTTREMPLQVFTAIRFAGPQSRIAETYRSWARNHYLPLLRCANAIFQEHGSYVQPLPWSEVNEAFEGFINRFGIPSLKGRPRCFAFIALTRHTAGWERVLADWERGDFGRLYPAFPLPFGILFYLIRMQDMLAKQQEKVSGQSYLSTTAAANAVEAARHMAKSSVDSGRDEAASASAMEAFIDRQSSTVLKEIGRSSLAGSSAAGIDMVALREEVRAEHHIDLLRTASGEQSSFLAELGKARLAKEGSVAAFSVEAELAKEEMRRASGVHSE